MVDDPVRLPLEQRTAGMYEHRCLFHHCLVALLTTTPRIRLLPLAACKRCIATLYVSLEVCKVKLPSHTPVCYLHMGNAADACNRYMARPGKHYHSPLDEGHCLLYYHTS